MSSMYHSSIGNTDHLELQQLKRGRSSKSVRQRKKDARKMKYNVIGVRRQQAIIASANVIRVDDEEVDLSDAFQFMDWYLAHAEAIANRGGPVPESIIIEFRDNLLALDLHGNNRVEKVQFIMDIVLAPELKEVCNSCLHEDQIDCTAVEAVEEVFDSINKSEFADYQQDTNTIDPAYSLPAIECVDYTEDPDFPFSLTKLFIEEAIDSNTCPVTSHDDAISYEFDPKYGFSNLAYYVATWTLDDFRRLFINDDNYSRWRNEQQYDHSDILNVRCWNKNGYTQHHLSTLYVRASSLTIEECSLLRFASHQSSGVSILTTGENACNLLRV